MIALQDGLMADSRFEVLEYDADYPLLLIYCGVLEQFGKRLLLALVVIRPCELVEKLIQSP